MSSSYTSTSTELSARDFAKFRQISLESDVFYPDLTRILSDDDESPRFMTSENPLAWIAKADAAKISDKSKEKAMEIRLCAQALAKLSAGHCVPKFFNTRSTCLKLHWACLAGWCMCKYQYQPLTPLYKLPQTKLYRNKFPVTSPLYTHTKVFSYPSSNPTSTTSTFSNNSQATEERETSV